MIRSGLTRIAIGLLFLLSLLPFGVLYVVSDFIFLVLYHVVKYRRPVVRMNLRNAFPEKTEAECAEIEEAYYRYLSDLIVECVKMITIPYKEAAKHFVFLNPEVLHKYFADGKSVILAAGHYGNWEMAATIGSLTDKKALVIYKPLASGIYEDFTRKVRSRFGAVMVPMKLTLRKIAEFRREPSISVFLSDQTPVKHETQFFTSFLNQPTAVFLGIEKIAKTTNYPVVFCDVRVVKRGYYSCNFVPLVENPAEMKEHEITEAHVRCLERLIIREPRYWLWSHRRWKFRPEDYKR
ncbi:lysophospholipid acyltransferase family protein [Hufsiella ginkgonis]|uniref:Lauroyl acyltransferase n=1 Tax=Hufsiella ginkgonis TaxID=2695274 RepID=A0A7K1XYP3_9SPHI|nr:lysophospholipid acyltransferase family protein [Hufsiella ginkgonis]MXV15948.1 lauroyl acyltransferase [Hufsiella ginkgonis]